MKKLFAIILLSTLTLCSCGKDIGSISSAKTDGVYYYLSCFDNQGFYVFDVFDTDDGKDVYFGTTSESFNGKMDLTKEPNTYINLEMDDSTYTELINGYEAFINSIFVLSVAVYKDNDVYFYQYLIDTCNEKESIKKAVNDAKSNDPTGIKMNKDEVQDYIDQYYQEYEKGCFKNDSAMNGGAPA